MDCSMLDSLHHHNHHMGFHSLDQDSCGDGNNFLSHYSRPLGLDFYDGGNIPYLTSNACERPKLFLLLQESYMKLSLSFLLCLLLLFCFISHTDYLLGPHLPLPFLNLRTVFFLGFLFTVTLRFLGFALTLTLLFTVTLRFLGFALTLTRSLIFIY